MRRGGWYCFKLQVATQQNLLNVLLGRVPQEVKRGRHLHDFTLPKQIPAGIPSSVLVNRPDIMKVAMDLMSASSEVNVQIANLLPAFTLTADYGNESLSLGNLLTNPAVLWQYGVSLVQTIFDAGKLTANIHVAEAIQRQLVHEYVSVVLTALQEVEDALIAHRKRWNISKFRWRESRY